MARTQESTDNIIGGSIMFFGLTVLLLFSFEQPLAIMATYFGRMVLMYGAIRSLGKVLDEFIK